MKYAILDYISFAILPGNGEIPWQGYAFTFVIINAHYEEKQIPSSSPSLCPWAVVTNHDSSLAHLSCS